MAAEICLEGTDVKQELRVSVTLWNQPFLFDQSIVSFG